MGPIFYTAALPGSTDRRAVAARTTAGRPRATIAIVRVAWWRIILIMDRVNPQPVAPDRGATKAMALPLAGRWLNKALQGPARNGGDEEAQLLLVAQIGTGSHPVYIYRVEHILYHIIP